MDILKPREEDGGRGRRARQRLPRRFVRQGGRHRLRRRARRRSRASSASCASATTAPRASSSRWSARASSARPTAPSRAMSSRPPANTCRRPAHDPLSPLVPLAERRRRLEGFGVGLLGFAVVASLAARHRNGPGARGGASRYEAGRQGGRRRGAEALRRGRRLPRPLHADADQRVDGSQDQLGGRGDVQEARAHALGLREAGQVQLRHRRRRVVAVRARRQAGVQAEAGDVTAARGAVVLDRQGKAGDRVRHQLRGQDTLTGAPATTCCRCRRRRPRRR